MMVSFFHALLLDFHGCKRIARVVVPVVVEENKNQQFGVSRPLTTSGGKFNEKGGKPAPAGPAPGKGGKGDGGKGGYKK